ncbi:MAG TPA: A24 family peptidase [Terriglobales bacterium]|nr:A24 family peptidase [Terriglobales bacterium]
MGINLTWNIAVMAFAITAAIVDVQTRKIPRVLTVTGFIAGLLYHAVRGGFVNALAAAAIGFVVGMALFSLGAIGGGDVKLVAALGAMLGFHTWVRAMEFAIFAAGIMALIQIIRHKAVRQTFRNIGAILRGFFTSGLRAHPVVNVQNTALIRSPFGLAAAMGTVAALLRV